MITRSQIGEPKTLRDTLVGFSRRVLDLIFPPRCVQCSKLGGWFCVACQATVEYIPQPICPLCGFPSFVGDQACARCQKSPLGLDGIRSMAYHDGSLRKIIHHLKYRQCTQLAQPLGRMLGDYWQAVGLSADLIVPVPLHAARHKERGYNQAALLAHELGCVVKVPVDEKRFKRVRETASQVGLGSQERQTNVQDAFDWQGSNLQAQKIMLLDDVCTTGATLQACAAALYQAGAEQVWALTLARAR